MTLEIVGIFHVNGYQPTGVWVSEDAITYNWIFTAAVGRAGWSVLKLQPREIVTSFY